MDANGTRVHLVSGARDWKPVVADSAGGLWWDPDTGSVSLAPRLARFGRRWSETPITPASRRGAARDRYGTFYWIDTTGHEIQYGPEGAARAARYYPVASSCARRSPAVFRDAVPADPAVAATLRGLAVTTHGYLVAGTVQPPGLLVFDLFAGGPPLWIAWPEQTAVSPFDITGAPDGGLWVLDRSASRAWRFNRFFQVTHQWDTIAPADTAVAIEALPDGSVLALWTDARGSSSILARFHDGEVETHPLAGALEPLLDASLNGSPDLLGHDMAFVASGPPVRGAFRGDLTIAADDGNDAFAFDLSCDREGMRIALLPRFLPLRRYSGKALVSSTHRVFYDVGDRWFTVAAHPRRRFVASAAASAVFDSRRQACVWHRLLMDGCIPPGTRVRVESRAADDVALLPGAVWQSEPAPYLRASGSELPHTRTAPPAEGEGAGTWEVLFQAAVGRHLQVRLTFSGDGRRTPSVRVVRVYYPRFSYVERYLPAVYRDDRMSAGFLDRYLANPEGLLTAIEGEIQTSEDLFDVRTTPADYIPWLAGWLGATVDPLWDDARRRLFLAYAHELFRWRGTRAGLLAAVRLATERQPDATMFDELSGSGTRCTTSGISGVRIVEHFLRRDFSSVSLGDTGDLARPAFAVEGSDWKIADGAGALDARYLAFVKGRYEQKGETTADAVKRLQASWGREVASFDEIRFPTLTPESEGEAADWLVFTRGLAFTYPPVGAGDADAYREFVARRYGRVDVLNREYALRGSRKIGRFQELDLPQRLPARAVPLADWIAFVSRVVPIRRHAHRFTVLIPARPEDDPGDRAARLEMAREVVQREKPAHTDADVKLYWALFQVGAARVGLDTVLGEGSRYVALVLGHSCLDESYLAEPDAWRAPGRTIVGRERLMENGT